MGLIRSKLPPVLVAVKSPTRSPRRKHVRSSFPSRAGTDAGRRALHGSAHSAAAIAALSGCHECAAVRPVGAERRATVHCDLREYQSTRTPRIPDTSPQPQHVFGVVLGRPW